jgi:hypothetical protein
MTDSADQTIIPVGATVIALDGSTLGTVREVHPHYVLVGEQEDPHVDFDVPVRAIARIEGKQVHLKVNRSALTEVDDTESANRRLRPET